MKHLLTAATAAGLALLACAGDARAQAAPPNYVELRGAVDGDGNFYRYAEYTRFFANGITLDSVYVGVPGQNELYLGAGYGFHLTPTLTLTPLGYAVVGLDGETDEFGLTLGVFIVGTAGPWGIYTFAGYFEPLSGTVPRYFFVDSLDVSRRLGKWELGVSTGHYVVSGEWTALVGGVVVHNDSHGAWRLLVRGGSAFEARLVRTISF
jgi:opacity protein-like surface antigen